jgi:hypothetical protein
MQNAPLPLPLNLQQTASGRVCFCGNGEGRGVLPPPHTPSSRVSCVNGTLPQGIVHATAVAGSGRCRKRASAEMAAARFPQRQPTSPLCASYDGRRLCCHPCSTMAAAFAVARFLSILLQLPPLWVPVCCGPLFSAARFHCRH